VWINTLQDVSLQLQAGELMLEDDATEQELQEEQQREAGKRAWICIPHLCTLSVYPIMLLLHLVHSA
jgi:hypothetical protein